MSLAQLPRATFDVICPHVDEAFVTRVAGFSFLNDIQKNRVALNAISSVDRTTPYRNCAINAGFYHRSLRECLRAITPEVRCAFLFDSYKDVQA
jgi:hypothetical protein